MAYKVLSVFLLVCLVGSIHAASFNRVKRQEVAETTTAPEAPAATETTESGTTAETTSTSTSTKSPLDLSAIFDNFGQIFPANNYPALWYYNPDAFFSNVPNWFGSRRS